jgi:hypothetical protein
MPTELSLVQGMAKDFPLQVYNADGTPSTSIFLQGDILTAKIWAGKDQPVMFTPTVTWVLPSGWDLGQYIMSFQNGDTSDWNPQIYHVQTYVSRGGRMGVIGDMTIRVMSAPGMASTLPVYCSLNDMLTWCRWIQQLNVFESDETGFLIQRNAARNWLDNVIQRHYRLTAGLNLNVFGNPVPTWGPRRTGGYSVWLQSQLDAGPAQPLDGPSTLPDGVTPVVPGLSQGLMLNPPRRTKEIVSKYATFLVMQDIIAGSGQRDNWYSARSDWLMQECENLIKGFTAEINPVSGYPSITVECGLVDVMRG